MISHRNVIANVLQAVSFEKSYRDALANASDVSHHTEVALGLLPQSHIYGLVVICHSGAYRGDQTIVLPKFELNSYLSAWQNFKMTALFLVSSTEFSIPLLHGRLTRSNRFLRSLSTCSEALRSVQSMI